MALFRTGSRFAPPRPRVSGLASCASDFGPRLFSQNEEKSRAGLGRPGVIKFQSEPIQGRGAGTQPTPREGSHGTSSIPCGSEVSAQENWSSVEVRDGRGPRALRSFPKHRRKDTVSPLRYLHSGLANGVRVALEAPPGLYGLGTWAYALHPTMAQDRSSWWPTQTRGCGT